MKTNGSAYYAQKHAETETLLLTAAKALLLENGFSRATMGEIAKQAGLSRQRAYQYFSNVDEIIYEIQIRDMEAFLAHIDAALSARTGTAGQDLLRLVEDVFAYEEAHSEDFLFTNEFDVFYRRRRASEALRERYRRTFTETDLSRRFCLLLREGQQSGEFRDGFDARDATAYWHNMMQLICGRIAAFRTNGEPHTRDERSKAIAAFTESLFRYLR